MGIARIRRIMDAEDVLHSLRHHVERYIERSEHRIKNLTKRLAREDPITLKAITGAIKSAIDSHGVITKDNIGSVAKRLYNSLADLPEHGAVRKRT